MSHDAFRSYYSDTDRHFYNKPEHLHVDLPEPSGVLGPGQKRIRNLRIFVYNRDGFTCRDCKRVFERPKPYLGEIIEGLTLGHIIPKSQGGRRTRKNLIAQCRKCNNKLGNRVWVEGWRDL